MSLTFKQNAIRVALLGLGLVAWAGAGKSLHKRGSFEFVPNAFSLKGSPFGRTLAMAMQGPVDVYFHQGEGHDHGPGKECATCAEAEAMQESVEDALEPSGSGLAGDHPAGSDVVAGHDQLLVTTGADTGHAHVHGESCSPSCDHGAPAQTVAADASEPGVRDAILERIRHWRGVKNSRTNPHSNSEAHKFFIRMEVEKKLFLTYEMDPTNYSGYGAYYLFLSESSLGTRAGSLEKARRLAEFTVVRCLREREDPMAMLTAAAASHDMVQILVSERSPEAHQLATKYATVTQQSLDQFDHLSLQMLFDGRWERFSTARQNEMTERAALLRKLHDSDRRTLRAHVAAPDQPEDSPAG